MNLLIFFLNSTWMNGKNHQVREQNVKIQQRNYYEQPKDTKYDRYYCDIIGLLFFPPTCI